MRTPLLIFAVAFVLVFGREYWLFFRLPVRIYRQGTSGDREGAIVRLERALRSFSVLGRPAKASAHFLIAEMYRMENRTEEAVRHLREAVVGFKFLKSPELEAGARLMLAMEVEALGNEDEAQQQRLVAAGPIRIMVDAEEAHLREALNDARHTGDRTRTGDLLVKLATFLHRRGATDEALDLCREALETNGKAAGRAGRIHLNRALILTDMGQWDEARAAIDASRSAPPLPNRSFREGHQALCDLAQAHVEVEAGRPAMAVSLINRRIPVLHKTTRVWANALGCLAYANALLGREEDAERLTVKAEAWVAKFPIDGQINKEVYGLLARAALTLGNFSRARDYVKRVMALNPSRVEAAACHFRLGEAARGEGDLEAARAEYRAAVGSGLATYDVQKARRRLEEMEGVPG